MCGISGFFGTRPVDESRIQRTLELMKNRGPDHQAAESFRIGGTYATLINARLRILDLDPRSNQPFTIGDYTMVFNGEIYNYIELRKELLARGISLRTESDTEVLLHYYILYGQECERYLEGMWAFAALNRTTGELRLSRDRFGEKPLYYMETTDGIYFGSEVKFLKSLSGRPLTVNTRTVCRYLVNGYKSLYKVPETFFKEVHEVPYASAMTLMPGKQLEIKRYWEPRDHLTLQPMSRSEAIEGFRNYFAESVRIRLRSDVPIAFCLSGGVDSSSIVSVAHKLHGCDVSTFSIIDPDERYNEYGNIRATVEDLGCKNMVIELKREGFLERLKMLVDYHDSPIATITYYIHSLLSQEIARQGFRVVFSGTAADELVTGYYDHFLLHLDAVRTRPDYMEYLKGWETHIHPLTRNPFLQDPDLYRKDPSFRGHIYLNQDVFEGILRVPFHEDFIEEHFCDELLRNRMLNELFHESTPVILHEDDLNSMLYSIENRSPFLDSRLFAFCYSIPPEHLISDGYGKFILRESMKGILNDTVRLDRHKKGFNASIQSVIDLKGDEARAALAESSPIYDIIDREKILSVIEKDELPNSYSKFLFNFFSAKAFLELNGV